MRLVAALASAGVLLAAGQVSAVTRYYVRLDTSALAGSPGAIVFDFVSAVGSANSAKITSFTTNGTLDVPQLRGGPVSGHLVNGLGPAGANIQSQSFTNELVVPFADFGGQITFTIELSEIVQGSASILDELGFWLIDGTGTVPSTLDPRGTNALFGVGITGAAGGDLTVNVPAQLVGADSIVMVPSGGSGGCPFVDTRSVSGWEEENSMLGRSNDYALEWDTYRLRVAPVIINGRAALRMHENDQEYTSLDQAHLVGIDHDPGLQAFDFGGRFVLGSKAPVHQATSSDSREVTSLLSGSGKYFDGAPGDTLYVQMAPTQPMIGFGAERTMPGEGGGGGEGGEKEMELAALAVSDAGTVLDAAILASTGILIQRPDGSGGWRTVIHYYPRAKRGEFALDSLSTGTVRLVFVGRHRLYSLFRIDAVGEPSTLQVFAPATADHSRLGNVRAALEQAGGERTALTPGDTLTMEFEVTPVPKGKVRDWFFVSRGVYSSSKQVLENTASGEERSLPKAFVLRQNHPNPFSRQTLIRFELPVEAPVRLEIFDAQGRRIRILANDKYPAGFHSAEWNQRDERGRLLSPGVYLYRLQASSFRDQKKMVLLP